MSQNLEEQAGALIAEYMKKGYSLEQSAKMAESKMLIALGVSDEMQLGGVFSSVRNAVTGAVKKAAGSIYKVPKELVSSSLRVAKSAVEMPIRSIVRAIGPEKSKILSSVLAFIPGYGQAAAAVLTVVGSYEEYIKAKDAAHVGKELNDAYSTFDANFSALGDGDKVRMAQLLSEAQNDEKKTNAAVVLLYRYARGEREAVQQLRQALDQVQVVETGAQHNAAIEAATQKNMANGMQQLEARAKAVRDLANFYKKLQAATPEQRAQFQKMAKALAARQAVGSGGARASNEDLERKKGSLLKFIVPVVAMGAAAYFF